MLRRTLLAAVLAIAQLVQTTTASAAAVAMPRGFEAPGPLAVTETGTLYVASGSQLYKLSGRRFEAFARACFSNPERSRCSQRHRLPGGGKRAAGRLAERNGHDGSAAGRGRPGAQPAKGSLRGDRQRGRALRRRRAQARCPRWRSSRACRECRRLEVLVWETWTQTAPATSTSVALETATASTSSRRRAMPALSARSGGRRQAAPLSIGPDGVVYGEWQNAIYQVDGGGISLLQGFSGGTVPKYHGTFLPAFIASSGVIGSPLYADADGGNGFSMDSAIIAVYPKHRVVSLWARLS